MKQLSPELRLLASSLTDRLTLVESRSAFDRRSSGLFRLLVVSLSMLVFVALALPGLGQTSDLPTVLNRAAKYVAQYEDQQLGNLLLAEDYVQNATSYPVSVFVVVQNRQQRRTQSDFLILLIGSQRIGLRKVNRVDGRPVTSREPSFETMLDDSPEGIRQRISAIQEESSFYNLGGVHREINVPTFALKVARENEQPRFSFTKRGTEKLRGVETWEIGFAELRAPTLVRGLAGESLLSSGVLWIEPETGKIMKTEFSVDNPFSKPSAKGRVTVTYADNKTLGMLVPVEMNERYETDQTLVNCTARYSNFRSFNVEVKSQISAPATPEPPR